MACWLKPVCNYMDLSCIYTKRYPETHNHGCYSLVLNRAVVVAKTALLPVKGSVPAPTLWILWLSLTPWLSMR